MLMRRVHQLHLNVQVGRISFVVVALSIGKHFKIQERIDGHFLFFSLDGHYQNVDKKGNSTIHRNKEITNNTIFYSDLSFMSQFEKNRDDVNNRLF